MSRRNVIVALCAAALLLAGGGLFASNMGFKLNYTLLQAGTASGTNTISLPFNRQIGIDNAEQLLNDINTTGTPTGQVANIQKFANNINAFIVYSKGVADPAPFTIDKGIGLHVKVNGNTNYSIVGSDDPAYVHTFNGSSSSADGTNLYSSVYHATATNAEQLLDELNTTGSPTGQVTNVQRWLPVSNSLVVYSKGVADPAPFALVPGEAYRVKLGFSTNVTYVPSHY
jgi:hypothetical protein